METPGYLVEKIKARTLLHSTCENKLQTGSKINVKNKIINTFRKYREIFL